MNIPFYEYFCPVKIIAGHKALEHIPFEVGSLVAMSPMLVTDPVVRAAGLLGTLQGVLDTGGVTLGAVFDDVPQDSSLQTVFAAATAYREAQCDSLIAVGGGSVIDTAKAVNILVSEGGEDLRRYSGAHNLKRPLKPLLVVPTTAGTGSEVSCVAVVFDSDAGHKLAFVSHFLLPSAAVLDSRMTLALPRGITAMTAMDAMTHSVEAYTCLAANPFSDAHASAAVRKIRENLLKVMDHPSDAQARLELAQASTLAGIAFSNSLVGMAHSLGHALGEVCRLPHGLCMSVLLPYVLEYNLPVSGERIGELLLPLAGADTYAVTPSHDRATRSILAIRTLRDELHARCELPRTLHETNKVARSQFGAVVELAIDDPSIVFNPREADRGELLGVLERAWN